MNKAQGSLSHPPHDGYRGEVYLSLHVLMSVCMVLLQDAMIVCGGLPVKYSSDYLLF